MSARSGEVETFPTIHRLAVPTPFPVGDVNAYLIDADPLTLVDSGPMTEEAWFALVGGIEKAGRTVREIRRLVVTHAHEDHAGLVERIRRLSGCVVYAHPVDHGRLRDLPEEWHVFASFLIKVCERAGVPRSHRDLIAESFRGFRSHAEPVGAVEAVNEGDVFDFQWARSTTSLRVLHTPGHVRGALSLWDPAGRDLLSGDTLLGEISSNALVEPNGDGGRERALPKYVETLLRIAALGTRRVLPGHGDVVEGDVKTLIAGRLRFHKKRAAKILSLARKGLSTPWEIADRLFPGLPPAMVFLAVSEVVGHLDLLQDRAEIAFAGQGDDWTVSPV